MAKIASELLIERLADWGVDTVFGLPGDSINGIMEGIRRHSDRVRFFLVHHEEAAAFMATAYAKATGKPAQLPGVVGIAIRTALARRGVAHLSLPSDIQVADADADPYQHVAPGGYGAKLDSPKKVESAIREALAFSGPAIVDVGVDPNEPPLPGKVSYEQARKFAQGFIKGQPRKAAIATTLFKDKIEQRGR